MTKYNPNQKAVEKKQKLKMGQLELNLWIAKA